jgi:hypothetical protein
MLLADGGCLTNPAVHPLLQRGATRLVVFLNYQTKLATRAQWDPRARVPTGADCSEEFPSLFGCVMDTAAWCFQRNAVFPPEDLVRVACALQDAAATGAGAVVTMRHVTVANPWFGIPAGHACTVTWCYLTAAPAWAAQLPAETAARLADANDAELGPTFPHFGTLDLSLSPTQVNLLHSLCTWTVMSHADQFRAALGEHHRGDDSGPGPEKQLHDTVPLWARKPASTADSPQLEPVLAAAVASGSVEEDDDAGVTVEDVADDARGVAGSHTGARSRVASVGRLAARALAATLLGARKRATAAGAEGGVAGSADDTTSVPETSRARAALNRAFATVRGVLPRGSSALQ